MREMQYRAFRELFAGAIPELFDDANGDARREIPDIHNAVISPQTMPIIRQNRSMNADRVDPPASRRKR